MCSYSYTKKNSAGEWLAKILATTLAGGPLPLIGGPKLTLLTSYRMILTHLVHRSAPFGVEFKTSAILLLSPFCCLQIPCFPTSARLNLPPTSRPTPWHFFQLGGKPFSHPPEALHPHRTPQFALGCGEGRTAFDSPAAQPLPSSWTRDSLRPGWPSSSHQTLPVPPGKPAFSICTLLFFTRCLLVAHSLTCLLQESVLQRAVAILLLTSRHPWAFSPKISLTITPGLSLQKFH